MLLFLKRKIQTDVCTIGALFVDGTYLCDTLEPPVREQKIPGKTAIPHGTYKGIVCMSPRLRMLTPRLLDVPDFTGVLIHTGNTVRDTRGCILVGSRKSDTQLVASRYAFTRLMVLLTENPRGEFIIRIENP